MDAFAQIRAILIDNPRDFIRWPVESRLWAPGLIRTKAHHQTLPADFVAEARRRGVKLDRKQNGPAVMAFQIAGGEVPFNSRDGLRWQVHHIYDGKFGNEGIRVLHATKDPLHFTHSGGLVALHPIAHAFAGCDRQFSEHLRREAQRRFGYDPRSNEAVSGA